METYQSIGATPLLTPVPVVMVSCKGKEGRKEKYNYRGLDGYRLLKAAHGFYQPSQGAPFLSFN